MKHLLYIGIAAFAFLPLSAFAASSLSSFYSGSGWGNTQTLSGYGTQNSSLFQNSTNLLNGAGSGFQYGVGSSALDPTQSSGFNFQPIVALPLPGQSGGLTGQTPINEYLTGVFRLAITVSVVLAVIMIIIDGFKYMTSEAVGNKKDALAGIRSALFGLILLLATYLILFIINPSILCLSLFNPAGSNCGVSNSYLQNLTLPGNLGNSNLQNLTSGTNLTNTTQTNPQSGNAWSFTDSKGNTQYFTQQTDCKQHASAGATCTEGPAH